MHLYGRAKGCQNACVFFIAERELTQRMDPAKVLVNAVLPEDHVGENLAIRRDDRSAGVVCARLQSEDGEAAEGGGRGGERAAPREGVSKDSPQLEGEHHAGLGDASAARVGGGEAEEEKSESA